MSKINRDNSFNESNEDIINENNYNERLEAILAQMLATSATTCKQQNLTFLVEDGTLITVHSGCQSAQAQVS